MMSDDEAFLDALFDDLVAAALNGAKVDVEVRLQGRAHLVDQVGELQDLAGRVARPRAGATEAPTRIAGHEIVRELGRGASSVVYLARQRSLGDRPVALKLLTQAIVSSGSDRRRFLAEVRALARLRHDNVIAVHDVIEADGVLGYSMEWIDGCSLRDLIQSRASGAATGLAAQPGTRWVPFVCGLGVALARALACVHAAGLLHRDVKPANVLVRHDGVPVLADFGLVRDDASSVETRAGAFLGTLIYAAPEQVRGGALDARADVYGLSATLYHALTLRPPVQGETTAAVLRRIEAGEIPRLRHLDRGLPRDLDTVIGRGMEADPQRRYPDAAAFADDLERVLGLHPIRARPPSIVDRVVKVLRRNRRAVAGAVTGVLLTVLTLVALQLASDARTRRRQAIEGELRAAQLALLDAGLRGRVERLRRGQSVADAPLAEAVAEAEACCIRALDLDADNTAAAELRPVLGAAKRRLRGEAPAKVGGTADVDARAGTVAAGVAAFLAGSFDDALRTLEPVAERDAFADGLLGQTHLALGQPERAYPRLLRVAGAFPEAGHLHAAAADAALRCGDATVARQLLAQSRKSAMPAPTELLLRLEADLAWLDGRRADASAVYTGALAVTELGYLRRNQILEAEGNLRPALMGYVNLLIAGIDDESARNVVRAARAWWAALAPSERHRLLMAGLTGESTAPPPLLGVLAVARRASQFLSTPSQDARAAFTVGQARVLPVEAEGIEALAARVDVDHLDIARCRTLSAQARADLVDAWLDPSAGERARALAVEWSVRLEPKAHAFERDLPMAQAPWRMVTRLPDVALTQVGVYGDLVAVGNDTDADGTADVLIAHRGDGDMAHRGALRVCSGNDGAILAEHVGSTPFEGLGFAVAPAVGVVGGGWLVGANPGDARPGFVEVRSGAGAVSTRIQGANPSDLFGRAIAGLGDVDGDGLVEIAIGAPGPGVDGQQRGRVEVWSVGGSRRFVVQGERPHDSLGEFVAAVGDIDGDGASDVAAGTLQRVGGPGYALVISGRTGAVLHRLAPAQCGPALRVVAADDVTGDGRPDFVAAWADAEGIGHVAVHDGQGGGVVRAWHGDAAGDGFGADVASIGDVDGDGLADLALTIWSEVGLLPPAIAVHTSTGKTIDLPGFWRLRRIASPPGSAPRFAAFSLASWSRFGRVPMGSRAQGAILELHLGGR